jgi:hypothetical protein
MKILGRELAVWLALIAGVGQVATSYGLDLDGKVQGIVTAGVVFVFAVAVAIAAGDGIIALASGVVVAAGSLFAAFGLEWTAEHQTHILGLITVVGSFFLRNKIVAPKGPGVSPPGKLVAHDPAS